MRERKEKRERREEREREKEKRERKENVYMTRCWQWGLPGGLCEERLDTANSSQLQRTHHRALLSPAAKMVTYLRKGKTSTQAEREGKKESMKQ